MVDDARKSENINSITLYQYIKSFTTVSKMIPVFIIFLGWSLNCDTNVIHNK